MRPLPILFVLFALGCEETGSITIDPSGGSDPADTVEGGDTTDTETPDPTDTTGGDDTVDTTDTTAPGDTTDPSDPSITDPPTQTDPCGTNLDVRNGTASVRLARVPTPGDYVGDPGEDGAFQVIQRGGRVNNPTRGRGALTVTSYAPSSDGTNVAPGSFPLVLLMPGFGANHTNYEHFSLPLASHGFIVVGLDFADTGFLAPAAHDLNAADAIAVLDWALSSGPYAAAVDATKIAATGHSLGGKIAFYAASLDSRIDMVIGWDPQNSGGPPCAFDGLTPGDCNDFPVAPNCEANNSGLLYQLHAESLVFGAEDGTLTPDAHLRADNFYRGAPSTSHFVHFPDASHAAWVFDGDESAVSRRVHTALLLSRFQGYTGLDAWLPGGAELAAVDIVDDVRSK